MEIAPDRPHAFEMGGNSNAWYPTLYILNGAVGSIDIPKKIDKKVAVYFSMEFFVLNKFCTK